MKSKKPSDKEKNNILKALAKQFGEGYDKRGFATGDSKAIPTGYDDLDCLLTKGAHGLYLGGVIELLGSEGSGKTSLALRTVGNAQKMDLLCCWIDAEAAFSENLAIINGCDPTQLVMPELADTTASGNMPVVIEEIFN